jgi:small subunit ribosomal protein S17
MTVKQEKISRRLKGIVVSDKMDKTVVVRVDQVKNHPIYAKKLVQSIKLKAHDEKNQYKVDDVVMIEECRPLSKDKRWLVIKKVK